jgi:hypothetical protein
VDFYQNTPGKSDIDFNDSAVNVGAYGKLSEAIKKDFSLNQASATV